MIASFVMDLSWSGARTLDKMFRWKSPMLEIESEQLGRSVVGNCNKDHIGELPFVIWQKGSNARAGSNDTFCNITS